MKKNPLLLLLTLCATLLLGSCNNCVEGTQTEDFNFGWKFTLAESIDQSYSETSCNDAKWESVRLPHDWSIEKSYTIDHTAGSNAFLPGGIGWYRKTFELPKGYAGKEVFVQFEGIYNNAKVWINNHYLGYTPNGYLDIEYNLTPYLNKGGKNIIAVCVDRRAYADARWYVGGGIYRNTHLIAREKLHIPSHGTYITTKLGENSADVTIQTKLNNTMAEDCEVTIDQNILMDGVMVNRQSEKLQLAANNLSTHKTTITLASPTLWNLESPKMYTLETSVYCGEKLLEQQSTNFGVRSAHFDSKEGFILNGKSVKIKGVNIHHDLGCVGVALYDEVLYRRLAALKAMGCNAIRTAHNPHSTSLMNMCDTMGLFVMDEFIDEWKLGKGKWITKRSEPNAPDSIALGYSQHFEEYAEADIKRFIERDRNHPSVMLWSIGNEIEWSYPYYWASSFDNKGYGGLIHTGNPEKDNSAIKERFAKLSKGKDELSETAHDLANWVREMDTTRPLTSGVVIPSVSRLSGYTEALDVVGYNYKDNYYEIDHELYPNQPILGTENVGQYFEWKAVVDKPYIPGIFVWTGIDYLGENGPWPLKGALYSLFDFACFKTPRGHFFECLWNDTPKTHIVTTPASESEFKLQADGSFETVLRKSPLRRWEWFDTYDKWNYKNDEEIVVQVYTNAPQVELQLNGQSLGTKNRADFAEENILLWQLPYTSGTLVAIGKEGDKEVSRHTLQTNGKAADIQLLCDKSVVKSDGYDLTHIEMTLVDDKGNVVTDAEQTFTIEHPKQIKILGVDNGSYTFVGKHQSNSIVTNKGKALVILQPQMGTITNTTITIRTDAGLEKSLTIACK